MLCLKYFYAQTLILVNLMLVNICSFFVIVHSPVVGFGRNLVEIVPTSLPDLPKQLRAKITTKNKEKSEIQNFKKLLSGIFETDSFVFGLFLKVLSCLERCGGQQPGWF